MKTAISLPDSTFERVTRRATELGMSRSELFTRAAEHFLDDLDTRSLTRRIDEVLDAIGDGAEDASADAVAVGRHTLAGADGDW